MRVLKTICIFSAFTCAVSAFAVEKKVRVERAFHYEKNKEGKYALKASSYRDTRPKWGVRFLFASSQIQDEITQLKDTNFPFQIDLTFMRNFKFFSVGPEVGYTKAEYADNHKASFMTAGLALYLDGFFSEPYVVPFASFGSLAYMEAENKNFSSLDSESSFVPYYRVGVLFALNWIEPRRSLAARQEWGLQNTFVYAGMRKYTSTHSDSAQNAETSMYLEYGLQLEF